MEFEHGVHHAQIRRSLAESDAMGAFDLHRLGRIAVRLPVIFFVVTCIWAFWIGALHIAASLSAESTCRPSEVAAVTTGWAGSKVRCK